MKYLKNLEEFNESFFGKVKDFFGTRKNKDIEEDDTLESETPSSNDEYRKLVDGIKSSFDEPRAIDYYMKELQKIGKWQEFINSKDGEEFKMMINAFKR
jgi:hypothetical protein